MILSRNSIQKGLEAISKTNTTWSKFSSSDLHLIKSDKAMSLYAVPEIKKMVQQLASVANITRVKAIATKFPDIHWIDFELELQSGAELSDEVWDNVQDLVIDCEWKLRDDSGEKWYFRPKIVNQLSQLRDLTEVIADSHNIQSLEVSLRTWSSPPLKLIIH